MIESLLLLRKNQQLNKKPMTKHQLALLRKKQRIVEIALRNALPKSPKRLSDLNILALRNRDLVSFYQKNSPPKSARRKKRIKQNQKKRRTNKHKHRKKINFEINTVEKKKQSALHENKKKSFREKKNKTQDKAQSLEGNTIIEKEFEIEDFLSNDLIGGKQSLRTLDEEQGLRFLEDDQGIGFSLSSESEAEAEEIKDLNSKQEQNLKLINSLLKQYQNEVFQDQTQDKEFDSIPKKSSENKDKNMEENSELLEEEIVGILTEEIHPDFVQNDIWKNHQEKTVTDNTIDTKKTEIKRQKQKKDQLRRKRRKLRRKRRQRMKKKFQDPENWPIMSAPKLKIENFLKQVQLGNQPSRKRKYRQTKNCFIQ
ncbi:hypothetical protein M0812_29050 [Anaeramoeba flamelloides]|uniref:Uncharacterized protein n=1 Tax=Anaeramoeba flamelloides TaxID=1746091 RepID=A0AAV7Y385_9EUKA|nr:hypothetical protein M0812_29050 [Anaeramoeba flamelloides]